MRASLLVALLVAAPSFAQQTPADTTRGAKAVLVAPAPSPYAEPAPPRERPQPRPAPPPPPVPAPRVFDAFGEFGLAFGGDDVAELLFTDGGGQTLTAGQGGILTVGAGIRPAAAVPVSAFASVGFKFLLNASNNADVRITRVPVEAGLAVHVTRDVWAEVAAVRHLGTELKGDDFFQDVSFESSTGLAVGAGWRWVGARFTSLRYTARDGSDFDASSVGIGVRASDL